MFDVYPESGPLQARYLTIHYLPLISSFPLSTLPMAARRVVSASNKMWYSHAEVSAA